MLPEALQSTPLAAAIARLHFLLGDLYADAVLGKMRTLGGE